jgi:hypothetical protein
LRQGSEARSEPSALTALSFLRNRNAEVQLRTIVAVALAFTAAACDSPPATQPEDFDTVNATLNDPAVAPGALDNESVNYGEGNITPAEQNNMGNALRSQAQPGSGNSQ